MEEILKQIAKDLSQLRVDLKKISLAPDFHKEVDQSFEVIKKLALTAVEKKETYQRLQYFDE